MTKEQTMIMLNGSRTSDKGSIIFEKNVKKSSWNDLVTWKIKISKKLKLNTVKTKIIIKTENNKKIKNSMFWTRKNWKTEDQKNEKTGIQCFELEKN